MFIIKSSVFDERKSEKMFNAQVSFVNMAPGRRGIAEGSEKS